MNTSWAGRVFIIHTVERFQTSASYSLTGHSIKKSAILPSQAPEQTCNGHVKLKVTRLTLSLVKI